MDIVVEQYENHMFGGQLDVSNIDEDDDVKRNAMKLQIFIRCLHVANRNLLCRYKQDIYQQLRGLAMGVADSPDLANLYGAYFEEKCGILTHPLVPYYGRYIDDCIALVYATSEAEALHIVSCVQFDGCTIEWSASDKFQPFLDMTIYRDGAGSLQHMPYRKKGNHMERIPWISHHPLDVKRGTYIGEMARLATLSSTYDAYSDAISSLTGLYIARGYPQDLVYKWTKDYFTKRWENRLVENQQETNRTDDGVLVLKSNFNTAWNYFSAKELGDTIFQYWRTEIISAAENGDNRINPMGRFLGGLEGKLNEELCSEVWSRETGELIWMPDIRKIDIANRRVIVSRKRTRNLFDLTSLWKKIVVTTLDRDASDVTARVVQTNPYSHFESTNLEAGDLEYEYPGHLLEL